LASELFDFSGRTVVVTGASSGIGREVARLIAKCNGRVVLVARTAERLHETALSLPGAGHLVEAFDLNDVEEIPHWVKSIATKAGPIAGVVHSAGMHAAIPLRMLDPTKVESLMRINVTAALMLAKGFRQKGCFASGASLVFLSSVAGMTGQPAIAAYSASKAALIGASRSLAIELAREGIRVNCVSAGMVKTEMSERIFASLPAEQFAAIEAMHPLGIGSPIDVAHAVVFLLAESSRWITGSNLVVDGGYTVQ